MSNNITDYIAIESQEGSTITEVYQTAGVDTSSEAREEAFQISTALGLTKQASAYKSESTTLIWPEATKDLMGLYCICFPKNTLLDDYDQPLPLSVLREVEKLKALHADEASEFVVDTIVVRSPASAAMPDPVMFATIRLRTDPTYKAKSYLIARWGSALLSIDELYDIAKKTVCDTLRVMKSKVDADIALIESMDKPIFNAGINSYSLTNPLVSAYTSPVTT